MSDQAPIILWFRRDLRLADHPALAHATNSGRPVIPLFICDAVVKGQGAATRFRLGLSLASLGRDLAAMGSSLILRLQDLRPASGHHGGSTRLGGNTPKSGA